VTRGAQLGAKADVLGAALHHPVHRRLALLAPQLLSASRLQSGFIKQVIQIHVFRTALHHLVHCRLAHLAPQLLLNVETAAPASLHDLDYVAGFLVQMPIPALPSRLHHTTSSNA